MHPKTKWIWCLYCKKTCIEVPIYELQMKENTCHISKMHLPPIMWHAAQSFTLIQCWYTIQAYLSNMCWIWNDQSMICVSDKACTVIKREHHNIHVRMHIYIYKHTMYTIHLSPSSSISLHLHILWVMLSLPRLGNVSGVHNERHDAQDDERSKTVEGPAGGQRLAWAKGQNDAWSDFPFNAGKVEEKRHESSHWHMRPLM